MIMYTCSQADFLVELSPALIGGGATASDITRYVRSIMFKQSGIKS
jgi:hypothetical protein